MAITPIQKNLWALFSSVFWPAATGSVFWSFCKLLIDDKTIDDKTPFFESVTFYNSIVLLVVAIYLSIEWLNNYPSQQVSRSYKFWIFDFLHLCSIIFVAISITENRPLFLYATYSFFLIISFGHWVGAWNSNAPFKKRVLPGLISFVGVIIVFLGGCPNTLDGHFPLSYGLVLILWLIFNKDKIKELTSTKANKGVGGN